MKIDLRFLFNRQQSTLGSFMGTMGELKVYPLSEIRAAHERIENKQQFGKIVVVP